MSSEEIHILASNKRLTPSELSELFDPMIASNFCYIYQKIMEQDSSTCSATTF